MALFDDAGNQILSVYCDNPQVDIEDGNGIQTEWVSPSSGNYEMWRRLTVTLDWDTKTFSVRWEDLEGSDPDATDSGRPFISSSASNVGEVRYGTGNSGVGDAGGWDDGYIDDASGPLTTSTLTTGTKSFSSEAKPDLTGLDYALNSQSIALDVIGSPGTASEETKSVTLTGDSSYSLDWSSAHTDFRIAVTLTSSDGETTPTVNTLSLGSEGGGSGGDADQNPNTTWEVQGATHDRSGNEYEGGGVVARYGG